MAARQMAKALEWRAVSKYYEKSEVHGSTACYAAGCRCDECRHRAAARRQIYRLKAKGIIISPDWIDPTTRPGWADDLPVQTHHDTPWMADAACQGLATALFYPSGGRGHNDLYDEGRKVCAQCPVADDCLLYAVEHRERDGLWGGLTSRQRQRVERLDRESMLEAGRTVRSRYLDC